MVLMPSVLFLSVESGDAAEGERFNCRRFKVIRDFLHTFSKYFHLCKRRFYSKLGETNKVLFFSALSHGCKF